ncbi:MAG: hypothetical protein ACRD1R_20250 [Acidobacteriota bacterium]
MKVFMLIETIFLGLLLVMMPIQGQQNGVPQAPIDLRAASQFEGGSAIAALNWKDQSNNELGFEILRSDNGGDYRVVGMVGANVAAYQDKVGKYITGAFTYKVRAFNVAGKSQDSNIVSVWF